MTQIFTNPVILTGILSILIVLVTAIVLFLWIKNKKQAQFFTNPVIVSGMFSISMVTVTALILFLNLYNEKQTQLASNINSSNTSTFRLMTAEEVSKSAGAKTNGLFRANAFVFPSEDLPSKSGLLSSVVKNPIGAVSDWHLHANWATIVYIQHGSLQVEFGIKGESAIEGKAGDFIFVPAGSIHRAKNIGEEEHVLIVFRVGKGTVATTVDEFSPE
jgi:uncharacterized RmlC-like cupin family protein